ncbi:hypothetical protein K0M31_001138 [Melipona bicolor]|uniref:Uncharacterized protein n=1 Tax=Melipona bicolor TaxID=60889 RepID=A0AA40KXX3_9HYME|nr:hypothetical protein K0M31_001138 [Melipona bicolor]
MKNKNRIFWEIEFQFQTSQCKIFFELSKHPSITFSTFISIPISASTMIHTSLTNFIKETFTLTFKNCIRRRKWREVDRGNRVSLPFLFLTDDGVGHPFMGATRDRKTPVEARLRGTTNKLALCAILQGP